MLALGGKSNSRRVETVLLAPVIALSGAMSNSQRIEEHTMTTNAVKQAPTTSLAVASAIFGVAAIAIASRAIEDQALTLLHVGSSLVSSLVSIRKL
jgi:hypothetical protein